MEEYATEQNQTMQDDSSEWKYLAGLAKEYMTIEESTGRGIDIKKETITDTRTQRQVNIANEIVEQTIPYLKSIASGIKRESVNVGKNRISNKNTNATIDELVQEGASAIILTIGKYNPEYALTSHIQFNAASAMYRYIPYNDLLVSLPVQVYSDARRIMATSPDENSAKNEMKKLIANQTGGLKSMPALNIADLIYTDIAGNFISIDMPLDSHSVASGKWGDNHLKYDPKIQDNLEIQAINEQVEEALETLTATEERVIRAKYGINETGEERTFADIGKEMQLTRTRIKQIEVKALQKLRHPSRSRLLEQYL